jgi:hypothetical protein
MLNNPGRKSVGDELYAFGDWVSISCGIICKTVVCVYVCVCVYMCAKKSFWNLQLIKVGRMFFFIYWKRVVNFKEPKICNDIVMY